MKITTQRSLSEGKYCVRLEVTEVTDEDRALFSRFGEPWIRLRGCSKPVTKISDESEGLFDSEAEARKYEEEVREQISKAMNDLRRKRDDFTSSEEFVV